jgi:hypothetical protein
MIRSCAGVRRHAGRSVGWFVMQARRRSWLGDALSGSLSKPNEPDHAALPCETTGWGTTEPEPRRILREPSAGRTPNEPEPGCNQREPRGARAAKRTRAGERQPELPRALQGLSARWTPKEREPRCNQHEPRGAVAAKGTRATVQLARAPAAASQPNEPRKLGLIKWLAFRGVSFAGARDGRGRPAAARAGAADYAPR